jgi:hypothetical protein
MPATELISNDLFLMLKSRFPSIKLGNDQGMSTVNPKEAVYFDFDFVINGEKLASISVSIAEDGVMKLFYSKDILQNQNNIVKEKWFDFLRDMRKFAKKKLLSFEPSDIAKKNLDKRDYEQMSAEARRTKSEEDKMNESKLFGSSKSSYQTLENTRLIIRHSQKVNEESVGSRTRHISAIFVENGNGERFQYPFNHLAGARAMMRHVANGGNPYDSFGQYIVGLSEQVYNLRKFNSLMHRNAFVENTQLSNIADAARQKTLGIKKTLERVQSQSGYENIKENFAGYERKQLDDATIESLKNMFTIQQFNEELVELFPYITDLLESGSGDKPEHPDTDQDDKRWDDAEKANGDEDMEEAKPFVKGDDPKTSDYSDSDAADEPVDMKARRDDSYELMKAIDSVPLIKMEPFSKDAITKAIDGQQAQIKTLRQAAAENPKDKKAQYAVEKAEARLGLLQARLATADPKADSTVTKNALTIEHLATHVKDDRISLLLSRISDDYPSMSTEEKKEVNMLIRKMMSKVKLVPMFASEGTTFEELESMLDKEETSIESTQTTETTDLEAAYEALLDKTISEKSELLSTDNDVKSRAIEALNELMAQHFPVGTNGMNAIESLRGIIDDATLFQEFKAMSKEDSDICVRPAIMQWIESNAPDLVGQIDTGDMKPVKAPKENDESEVDNEPKEDSALNEVEEFVKSLYDRHTGRFPRGETGVLASVEKKFGEKAVNHAHTIIETLKQSFDENIMRMRKLAGVS